MFQGLEPIPGTTRRAHIAASLRGAILGGQFPPGTQLVEARLAEQLGVSRGPLREAIRELINEGLLHNRPYAGTFVIDIDQRSIAEVYSVRGALERHAFTLVWPRRDALFAKRIRSRHDALIRAIVKGDLARQIEAEMHFHACPYEFSGNALLFDMWGQLAQRIRLCFSIYQKAYRGGAEYRDAHLDFLHRALGDDLNAMLEEVDRHLEAGLHMVMPYLAARS